MQEAAGPFSGQLHPVPLRVVAVEDRVLGLGLQKAELHSGQLQVAPTDFEMVWSQVQG